MENKKRVATVFHANGVERFVFDELIHGNGFIEYRLEGVVCAIVYPKDVSMIKFSDYVVPNKRVPFSQSDFDKAFSGTPNEHNMNPDDAEWYKNHMENQPSLKGCEKVCFWANPDGSYGADTELTVGDELVGLTYGGDTDYIRVISKHDTIVKRTYCYSLGRSINPALSWYITKRV